MDEEALASARKIRPPSTLKGSAFFEEEEEGQKPKVPLSHIAKAASATSLLVLPTVDDLTPMQEAVKQGHLDQLKQMTEQYSLDVVDAQGQTLLRITKQ